MGRRAASQKASVTATFSEAMDPNDPNTISTATVMLPVPSGNDRRGHVQCEHARNHAEPESHPACKHDLYGDRRGWSEWNEWSRR